MDKKTAKDKLRELRDSLSKVLDEKEFQSAEEIKEQSQEALDQAHKASKQFKKTLVGRIKELPIVDKVSQLGTAGTVAVSSAAVVQTELAVDQTQVFIAEIANDVVEQRIEAPFFLDAFVDFYELNDWGQVVIAEKVSEAQAFVESASEQQSTSKSSAESSDAKPESSASSQDKSSDKSSQPSGTEKSQQSEQKQSESKEDKSSKNTDSKEDNKGKQESDQEPKTEDKKQAQQNKSSSESNEVNKDVKPSDNTQEQSKAPESKSEPVIDEIPLIETPIDYQDDIKPHNQLRHVSPTY